MDHRLRHTHGNAKAEQITLLLKEFQQRMPRSTNFPQQNSKPLNLPFRFSFTGQMQFRMAIIATLLKAALKQTRIVEEQKRNLCKHMEAHARFERMLEESADMYAGLEFEYEKQKLEFEGLKYKTRKFIHSSAIILEFVRVLLQKDRDLPELRVLLQSKDFLYVCEGIIVEAATNILDSHLQCNTEQVVVTIFLLQKIYELANGKKALVDLEMDQNRENNGDRKTLIWALIVLFCKQSNNRENIIMILLAYTTSKDGAKMLVSHQLDKILVSMVHSETDRTIKETSIDILCSLVSLNDARCLRIFRSSPEAAAEFIKTLKREGSVKIKRMADYLAGKFFEQLEYDTPTINKFHSKS